MENWPQLTTEQQVALLSRPALTDSQGLSDTVADIIEQVKQQGDAALLALTEKFDGAKLSSLALNDDELHIDTMVDLIEPHINKQ